MTEKHYLSDETPVMMWESGPLGELTFFSQAWQEFWRLASDESEHNFAYLWRTRIHPTDYSRYVQAYEFSILHRQCLRIEYRFSHKDGSLRWILETASPRFDEAGTFLGLTGSITDITEKKRSEAELHEWKQLYEVERQTTLKLTYLAHHDALTGLPNRTLFLDRLSQAVLVAGRKRRHLSVLYVDLDHFKRINDSLGSAIGDQLLRMAAKRLTHAVYDEDSVTRIAADQFAVLLQDLKKPSHAFVVADKILSAFKEPFFISNHEFFITASIGISVFPADGFDAETLLKNADLAMYRAKEQGGNNYQLYSPAMNNRAMRRLKMENHLRYALSRNELRVHYQPQVDAVTGEIMAMEALCRWNHPEFGTIMPGEFIPLAEEMGLIGDIGEWMLEAVFRQAKEWNLMGLRALRIAVNLSLRQLKTPKFSKRVGAIIEKHGFDASLLEFEITESVIMENLEDCLTLMNALRSQGIRIAIDDFGTGYSSLSRLSRLPINTVKIDRSFVRNVHVSSNDAVIALAILSMAHSLNLTVVAEGVENIEQHDFLRSKGCDILQGYYYSKPVPADLFAPLVASKFI